MKVGIVASHPIQYQVPWFRALAERLDLEVFYCHAQNRVDHAKAGFGVEFDWDVDLFSRYKHRFLKNTAARPSPNHFGGCNTPEIRRIIAAGGFDACIVTGWNLKSYWQAAHECRRLGVPVLVRGDSQLNTPRSFLKRFGKELVYPRLLSQFDGFLAVGKRNLEYLSHYSVARNKTFFVPHSVDNEWFTVRADAERSRRHEVRRSWNITDTAFCPLFVGKFIDKKRPFDLIRALALLNRMGLESTGVFVGAGELEGRLKAEAKKLAVDLRFAGFKNQTELPACYASADVLVLPSDGGETWGLVVNEAMACGLPAIVSDAVGCGPDMVEEGKTGFVFPLGDVAALADCLQRVHQMLSNRSAVDRALVKKTAQYSLQLSARTTLEAIEYVVGARTPEHSLA